MFERVLIANRGEIARRVVRTCRRLGIATVAVHSDADTREPHVRDADEAFRIGPGPAADSYLGIDRLVEVARASGCDAVHPGYGFLAENARFAAAVADAGLAFVGPRPEVIRLMGDKAAAKRRLAAAGVPVVPGEDRDELSDGELVAAATDVGVPLLVKAVAGGGGKGMRAVHHLDDLPAALAAARREARAAFDDERVILERLVPRPRHVEVQVFGDTHGRVVHLLERECSVQRRHQKVVEECPSPAVDTALRARMGAAAVAAAEAVGYTGAGTVEFLLSDDSLDRDEPEFFFLEMNTRLQVEHPVTELVTGLDLVEWQLRVAAGEPLPLTQDEIRTDGHAVEVRLYAEDPVRHLPQLGPVLRADWPTGPGIRVDAGVETGSEVSRFYDPMLAKLVAHGADRDEAVARLRGALAATTVHGVVTNLELLDAVLAHPSFAAGALTTAFLDDHLGDWRPAALPADDATLPRVAAALADAVAGPGADTSGGDGVGDGVDGPWRRLGAFRPGAGPGSPVGWPVVLEDPATEPATRHTLVVTDRGGRLRAGGDEAADPDAGVRITVVPAAPAASASPTAVWVSSDGRTRRLAVVAATRHADASAPTGAAAFTSSMPGAVLRVEVTAGERVAAGATLVVVEAMKMEHPVTAPAAGTVTAVHVTAGQPVDAGAALLDFEPDDVEPDADHGGDR